jgi:hypothetical protein
VRAWLFFLTGPLIWAAHFFAIYAIASAAHVAIGEVPLLARVIIAGLSIAALLVVLFVLWRARRASAEGFDRFWNDIAACGALLAIFAVIWQTLPVLFAI